MSPKKEGPTTSSPTRTDSVWKARARKLVFYAIVLQIAGFVVFCAMLFLGERSRLMMLALYAPRTPLLVAAVAGAALARFTRIRHVRALLVAQAGIILLTLFPVMGLTLGHSRSASSGSRPIRLATYNIYFGKLGRTAVLDEIAAMDADIVLLQATWDSLGDMKTRFPDRNTNRVDDFIIVTRFPIKSVEEPPPLADGEFPKFVGYVLETPDGPLRVYNVHPFSPRHALFEDEETAANIAHREAQAEAVAWAAKNDGPPFVLAGDTNLPPGSAIARRHFGSFKDAFDEVGFGFGYTFPAKRPWMRIDRVFGGDRIRFLDVRVGPRGSSDHRHVVAELEIERR